MRLRRVLNTGSGSLAANRLHPGFPTTDWEEIRLDVDADTRPDVLGSFTAMQSLFEDATFDAAWSSHSLEHLYAHEVVPALREIRRILRPDGFAVINCPDLKAIAQLLSASDAETVAYQSNAGPIRVLDMIYGHAKSIAAGHLAMAHKTGFTVERLGRVASEAGFAETRVVAGDGFDLWALLLMPRARLEIILRQFAGTNIADLFRLYNPSGA